MKEWNEERSARGSSGSDSSHPTYYDVKGAYLGAYYIDTAFSRYYQKRISIDQLANYLRVKVKNVAGMELRLLGRGGAV